MSSQRLITSTALAVTLSAPATPGLSQTVLTTNNGVIEDSLCVGFDCNTSVSFGFDTIVLKENNLRILFDDTSSGGSFPSNDWRLIANDTSAGGANYFAIQDAATTRSIARFTAGAPANSLVVDSNGDLGIGTSTPPLKVSIKDGDSPGIRLEQDGTSGFTAQTWDIAGNETNFFVRDATNGSALPFRIKPGAPSSSIFISDDGDVGFGTASPSADVEGLGTQAGLHIRSTDGTGDALLIEETGPEAVRALGVLRNNGSVILQLSDTSANGIAWNIQNRGDFANEFRIVNGASPGEEFVLSQNGDLKITGALTTSGAACNATPCDAVFDPALYTVPSIEEHAARMWANKYLPAVGPTSADRPVNVSDKMLKMLNELEHAHIYIAQLHERIEELEQKVAALAR